MNEKIKYLNPEGLMKSPAFSQLVTTHGNGTTIYVGGQDAVNQNGEIVGQGDLAKQTEQVLHNLQVALKAAGATFENLVRLTIYIVQGQDIAVGFQASQKFFKDLENPPAISGVIVAGLANPDFLVEVDAIAFVSA